MNTKHENAKDWTFYERKDGLIIVLNAEGNYEVTNSNRTIKLNTCICCGKPFANRRAAQLVANAVYPLKEEGSS